MTHTRSGKRKERSVEISVNLILFGIIIPIIRIFFSNGIHLVGVVKFLGFEFIFIETTKRLDFQFESGFKGFPFFIKGGLSHLDTQFFDVGQHLFPTTTVGSLHASEWREMLSEILGTDTMGG